MTSGHRTNWAGTVAFRGQVHEPASLPELRRLVATSPRVRPLGTGHSFNTLPDTDGDLVSPLGLPPVIEIDRFDGAAAAVSVAGGVRYGELAGRLQRAGLALPNLGSLPHISVAGAVATGTHGSGARNGSLATAVSGLELVTADGDLLVLSRDGDPDRFPGAVVSLGALGVVTRVTLDAVPTFDVRQVVYDDLPFEELRDHLDDVLEAAYSVSVFTTWDAPLRGTVWVKQRLDDAPPEPPERWHGGTLADGPRHPIPGMSSEHATEQLGVPGPWHQRLPHFRMGFTPSSGEEIQSEYLVPREHGVAALDALAAVRHEVAPVLQICELRTVAADDQWLSMAHGRDSLALHFTWVKDADAVAPAVAALEGALASLDARPHWGKVFGTPPEVLARSYQRMPDFVRLVQDLDPGGKFRNAFLDRYLPVAVPETP